MSGPVEDHVIACGRLGSEQAKRDYLQQLIGPPSTEPAVLQFSALLVSALQLADVWPHRPARDASAFE